MKKLFLLLFLLLAIPGLGHAAWDYKLSCTGSGDKATIYVKRVITGDRRRYVVLAVKIGAGPYFEFKVVGGGIPTGYFFHSNWVTPKRGGVRTKLHLRVERGGTYYFIETPTLRKWTMSCTKKSLRRR